MTLIVILICAYHVMLVGEFFLPTGGTMGIAAVVCFASAIAFAFSYGLTTGVVVTALLFTSTPLVLSAMVKVWPHTPIGRRILNRRPGQLTDVKTPRHTRDGKEIAELVGQAGIAKTDLLPSGLVVVNGQKFDALTSGPPIDAGSTIVVTEVVAGRIHVRLGTESTAMPVGSKGNENEPSSNVALSPPALEQSLESLEDE
ncbi:hypothetical protein N9N28_01950 [Rubripirellula amarantea]|nr:hypothetical protein [Rubripirellula amarantea]